MRPGLNQWKGALAQEMFDSFLDLAALTDKVLIHAARLSHHEVRACLRFKTLCIDLFTLK